MSQFFAVVLRELLIFKKRLFKQLMSYTISPLLFLVTFGWGFGDKVDIDGTPYIIYMIPGLIAMNSMRHSFSLSTEINISRFYWKTFDEIRSTPIRDVAYTSGEMISGVIKGMIASFIVILLFVMKFNQLTIKEASQKLDKGEITSVELTEACYRSAKEGKRINLPL